MTRIAGLVLRQDVPQTVQLAMLTQQVIAAQLARIDIPDPQRHASML
jgi:hypothetical protein